MHILYEELCGIQQKYNVQIDLLSSFYESGPG